MPVCGFTHQTAYLLSAETEITNLRGPAMRNKDCVTAMAIQFLSWIGIAQSGKESQKTEETSVVGNDQNIGFWGNFHSSKY